MNFNEVLDLHRAVSAFHSEASERLPNLCVYDTQIRGEDYVLCVRLNPENDAYVEFVKNIAAARKLEIRKFREYLMLYSWCI